LNNNSTQLVDVHGKVKYIHAGSLNKYGKWSITLIPDSKSLDYLRDLQSDGLKNVMKKDEDNQYYMAFSREPKKVINGRVVMYDPPKCVDKDNKPLDPDTIGWGSDVTVRLEVYSHKVPNTQKRAKAARFEGVKVLNLIVYENGNRPEWDENKEKPLTVIEPEPW